MSDKLSEEMLKKLLGKRTPLPGGDKQMSPQMRPKAPEVAVPAASAASAPTFNRKGLTNPKQVIEDRLAEAEKGMKAGGKVRGSGCASKGFGKGRMR